MILEAWFGLYAQLERVVGRDETLHYFWRWKNGKRLLSQLCKSDVSYFCDNYKFGEAIEGKRVLSFQEMQDLLKRETYEVILSTNSDEMRSQLVSAEISFFEYTREENNLLAQEWWKHYLDEKLYRGYCSLDNYVGNITKSKVWFRDDFLSEKNKLLVTYMKASESEKAFDILGQTYDDKLKDAVSYDEDYGNRPGMRLIAKIIQGYKGSRISVCDFACGHGDFLKQLKKRNIICAGIDSSVTRCKALEKVGIECRTGTIEDCGYEDESFNCVTMMECLEHVGDPFSVMREARRILKRGGHVFVTVPYGKCCESEFHVRHFYENDLYSVAKCCNYAGIKIMRLPYLNKTFDDNLLLIGKKED